MVANGAWVNELRADALAKLYLTRRADLDVFTVPGSSQNRGYDLLVRVVGQGTLQAPEFGVDAKGTRQSLENARIRLRAERNVGANGGSSLPICLFVFNIDSEQGVYRWLIEPVVSPDGRARLLLDGDRQRSTTTGHPPYEKLDEAALDQIVSRVIRWYGAKEETMRLLRSSS